MELFKQVFLVFEIFLGVLRIDGQRHIVWPVAEVDRAAAGAGRVAGHFAVELAVERADHARHRGRGVARAITARGGSGTSCSGGGTAAVVAGGRPGARARRLPGSAHIDRRDQRGVGAVADAGRQDIGVGDTRARRHGPRAGGRGHPFGRAGGQ